MESPLKGSPVRPGFLRVEVQKTTWDVPERYAALRPIGSGAYGTVWPGQGPRPHVLLQTTPVCAAVCPFVLFYTVCLNLFSSLQYIHSAGIVHRDLKPGNLAVDENCELKILDFGLARQTESEMTGYVVTRWYRAPEVIFNWMHYSQTVDVWSAACILAEMITGHMIFNIFMRLPEPACSGIDQLKKILRLTGTPDSSLVQKMQSKDAQSYVLGLPPQKKKNLKEAVGILEGMLLLDPETRLTVKQGLSHPFLAEYHDPESEPDSEPYDDSFESLELAVGEWKSLIHMEIMTFDPDNPSKTAM
ncbi:mitogen-activated protein kinase 14A-like [Anarhichas minor]|uniref:mitogen-activated protein kinase 14A-like n=1 Tax=Anarhichas minor TaxID=65739 RepID=UPI003F7381BD